MGRPDPLETAWERWMLGDRPDSTRFADEVLRLASRGRVCRMRADGTLVRFGDSTTESVVDAGATSKVRNVCARLAVVLGAAGEDPPSLSGGSLTKRLTADDQTFTCLLEFRNAPGDVWFRLSSPFGDALARADAAAHGDLTRLDPVARVVRLVSTLEFELALGGAQGWLSNSSGRYAIETVDAMETIGAHRCADLVRRIVESFPERPARDDVRRAEQVAAVAPALNAQWGSLVDQLLAWPDDVGTLLPAYVERSSDLTCTAAETRAPRST